MGFFQVNIRRPLLAVWALWQASSAAARPGRKGEFVVQETWENDVLKCFKATQVGIEGLLNMLAPISKNADVDGNTSEKIVFKPLSADEMGWQMMNTYYENLPNITIPKIPNIENINNLMPSGKRLQNYGKSPFLLGKSTINDIKWPLIWTSKRY